ncbi:MAG: hypothetical protein ACTHMS_19305 [Jatrophihabitans sp.]|uniref:hypothetical protein n=1 Tax=Jatrophihabitans sp. TaxID=1932789 RepID=UPI003F807DB8
MRSDRFRRAMVLPAAGLVVALAAPSGVAPASAAPVAPAPVPPPGAPSLPLHLNLLGVQLNLDVPLSLPGVVGTVTSLLPLPHPTSSPPAPTRTPPPTRTTTPPPPPSTSSPTPRPTTRPPRTTTARPTPVVVVPPRPRPTTSRPRPTPTPTVSRTAHPKPPRSVVDVATSALSNLVPTSLARLLYLLTTLATLGLAAAIIRMGRRGTHG